MKAKETICRFNYTLRKQQSRAILRGGFFRIFVVMRRAAKVDANQNEIVSALRKVGAAVVITSQLKNAFDLIVGYRGKLYIMEVKDGEKPKSSQRLTEGEQKCADLMQSVGVDYHVVLSIESALKIIGATK